MTLPTLLTGYRTSGPLHMGHYFGMMNNACELSKTSQAFIMAADVQTLTDNFDNPQKVRDSVMEATIDMLSLDFDLDSTTFFIQSQIPAIAELTVFFSNLISLNRVLRNPTVKTEIEQKKAIFGEHGESVNFGFVGYPVSQAADILFLRASIVPVGADQAPMLELARGIAEKFNSVYSTNLFQLPEIRLTAVSRLMGLDGNAKMSKSLGNTINIKDTEEETIAKIKSAKTDSGSTLEFDLVNRPEISNLVTLFALFNNIDEATAVQDLIGIGYGTFKTKLSGSINDHFRSIRQRREEWASKPDKVKQVLEAGRQKTLAKAEETMRLVRAAMKIDY